MTPPLARPVALSTNAQNLSIYLPKPLDLPLTVSHTWSNQ